VWIRLALVTIVVKSFASSATVAPNLRDLKPELTYFGATSVVAQTDKPVEDICITRNIRVSRSAPTAFCDAAGLAAQSEDAYEYHAVATDPSGRVATTMPKVIGQLHACIGSRVSSRPVVVKS